VLLGMSKKRGEEVEPETELTCPTCGFTRRDFEKTGRLGCCDCYDTFGNEIAELLQRLHKGVLHKGKALSVSGAEAAAAVLQKKEAVAPETEDGETAEDFQKLVDEGSKQEEEDLS